MLSIPTRKLRDSLIFYITCIVIVTNGAFAIIAFSRENIALYNELLSHARFLGQILQPAARKLLTENSSEMLENFLGERPPSLERLKISVYDENFWLKWGESSRIPPEGFPIVQTMRPVVFKGGARGISSSEIFFLVADDSTRFGTIAVGIPEFASISFSNALPQVLVMLSLSILLGITVSMVIFRIIQKPMDQILEGLQAIQQGNYSRRIIVSSAQELELMGEMFNKMAATLEEKTLETVDRARNLDEKVQELWEIYELSKQMGYSLELNEILETFFQKARTLSFSAYGRVLLIDQESGVLHCRIESGSVPDYADEIYRENLELCIETVSSKEASSGEDTFLFVPLPSNRVVQGVLFLGKKSTQPYSEGILRFLEIVAPLGGSLIQNARLYERVLQMRNYVQNILNSVDAGVITIDRDFRLITLNKGLKKLLKLPHGTGRTGIVSAFSAEETSRQSLFEFVENLGCKEFSSGLISFVQQEENTVSSQELSFNPGTPHQKIFRVSAFPLLSGNEAIGKVITIDDQTEFKRIEEQMIESEKWAVLGRLAASIAHEIRNPLVAIRSLVELIGEDISSCEAKDHVKVIINEVKRLNRVVEELLALSKPEATSLRKVNVLGLINELILLTQREAARTGVSIVRDWDKETENAVIDPEKIKQAFLNIMLNAVQSMPTGGTLTIRVERAEAVNLLKVEFQDTGHGIQPKLKSRIFDPFFTTRAQGTGLGLAICQKIVQLHNGNINVESMPGKGTTFRIFLPDAPESILPAGDYAE